ncbi:DUF2303 family protein [Sulfuriferula sp.]|uniref:DUF2303 family protein n=1 Tax=Sulfuriferula sp. TaxID=2025307 RepID=UPI00272F45D2|nr:DUF2303 family protein [Sulfuriferula sp.]MDP2026423.1 DUF2303 family protein [Sulfuriferula sp.]
METKDISNLAETLAREMKAPVEVLQGSLPNLRRVAVPAGWSVTEFNDEKYRLQPTRKKANVVLHDTAGFIDYVTRHGSLDDTTIWCKANYAKGLVSLNAIINDHGIADTATAWRDHLASYTPTFASEWTSWLEQDKKPLNQAEFAMFLETNLKDIATVEGSPTGAQILEMALSFEANQDMRFKSAIRLQNGGVQMSFVQDDDDQTLAKMQMFDRFSLGLPVFWNGEAYRLDARLRYRVRDGKLSFWYEIIRADKVLESATQTIITEIRDKTGLPFFFGEAFA